MAFGGKDLRSRELAYAPEDLVAEPTQKRLQQSSIQYVPFLTGDNKLLDELFSALANSPTLSAIVEQKTAYSLAGGFYARSKSSTSILPSVRKEQDINLAQAEKLDAWLQAVNYQGENIEELSAKVFRNLWSFGNCFIELKRWTGPEGKEFAMEEIPIYLCRPKRAAKGKLWPTHIGVSEEFQEDQLNPNSDDVNDYPLFPNWEVIEGVERCIVHLKTASPNFYYWGKPDWLGARLAAEMEYRQAKFNQSKFENGFMPSALINVKADMTKAEARKLINDFSESFTSTGNNSKMFMQVQRDPNATTEVELLDNKEEGEFMALANHSKEQIVSGCRWTHSLAGMRTAGSLGTNQQILAEFDIVEQTVIKPMQAMFLKRLNQVLQEAGEWLGEWQDIYLGLNKATPISAASAVDPTKVMTMNEQREVIGLRPIDPAELGAETEEIVVE